MTRGTLPTHTVTLSLLGLLGILYVEAARSGNHPAGRLALAASAGAAPAPACPLSPLQERAAVIAFDKMMPVLMHARCVNCHGGVDPFEDEATGGHKGGKQDIPPSPFHMPDCSDGCHTDLPGWRVPGAGMFFVGKSAADLCEQFQVQETPAGFVDHIRRDKGHIQLIAAGFKGDRAGEVPLSSLQPGDKPPGDQAALTRYAQEWVDAIGAGWDTPGDCGCTIKGTWEGTVKARGIMQTYPPIIVSSNATVRFEVDTSRNASGDRHSQYYKATSGIAYWNVQASGPCSGSRHGMIPLDRKDPDGHPMAELSLEDNGDGSMSYLPATGSWPARWSPDFNLQCPDGQGGMIDVPATNFLTSWWQVDLSSIPVTRNLRRLEGSYHWLAGGIDIVWQWDLTLHR